MENADRFVCIPMQLHNQTCMHLSSVFEGLSSTILKSLNAFRCFMRPVSQFCPLCFVSAPKYMLPVQANSRLSQTIKSREAEANYTVLVDDVLRLVTELNGELKQAAMM